MISSNVEINKRQNLERWKKQIEEQKKLYDENRPLKKEEVIKMYAQ